MATRGKQSTPPPSPPASEEQGQDSPLLGLIVAGRYRIESLLGEGGMGAVYAATHLLTGDGLAIKLLLPEFSSSNEIISRFRREAQATSMLHHPNIIDVLDLGSLEDGTLFLVMDRVEGNCVADLVATGPMGVRRSLVLTRQVLDALSYAHEQGVIHRDLKPENLMIEKVGEAGREYESVKIIDFGLVKLIGEIAEELALQSLTKTGVVFGTPGYMAPEQALGRQVDPRADLYAVGSILFEMLTGCRPFESDEPLSLLRLHVSQPPPSLASCAEEGSWVTPEIEELVARALQKEPERRCASAKDMIAVLDRAFLSLNHLPSGL